MKIKIIKVTGNSLYPDIRNGDYLIILKARKFMKIKPGDVIVFNHRQYGRMVKSIKVMNDDEVSFLVEGKNRLSIDSNQLGRVYLDDIDGKMIFHIPRN